MKPAVFHEEAENELLEAAAYYEAKQCDLGRRFIAAVQDAVNRILLNPKLYPEVESGVQHCLTKVFPFGVLFRERQDKVEVIAVMHLHREPGYWQGRKG